MMYENRVGIEEAKLSLGNGTATRKELQTKMYDICKFERQGPSVCFHL